MQIDFHHGATYVCARIAGFDHASASTIAYCAQYVDDATNAGIIRFENGSLFYRISSAHKMLDYRNFQELANHRVWIPFHFLPGNGNLLAGEDPPGTFIDKLICRPNSPVAQEMVRDTILQPRSPFSLHRLGIVMHVYVDTWAHQGFAGVNHRVNEAKQLMDQDGKNDRDLLNRLAGYFIGEALPLGHGSVLGHPDKPFLCWSYTNGRGERVVRNNPKDFLEAADQMCRVFQRYRLQDPDAEVAGLSSADRQQIQTLFHNLTDKDGKVRHQKWLDAIAAGAFSFGAATVSYQAKGIGSWKYLALGTEKVVDKGDEIYKYHPNFLRSDWKCFHDALQAHRFYVMHELLPRYGICAA
ncbi:MAG: DUF6765 family protein [Synechococcales bacterium]|nr:DUF6765 family protein [Synechococcales bacterium]